LLAAMIASQPQEFQQLDGPSSFFYQRSGCLGRFIFGF
jgi:hypothetical protein